MRVLPARLDVVYEGRFGTPSLDFAVNPGLVLKSLVKTVSSRWAIASQDITVLHSYRVSDVRLRATLFNGRGTLEVDADKVGAHFQDARPNAEERATIRNCLKLALDGIAAALKGDPIANDTLRMMVYAELLEEPINNLVFLRSLMPESRKLAETVSDAEGSSFGGGIKFDVNNEKERWLFVFEMSRAFRSPKEIFVSGALSCFGGCRFASLDERFAHLERLLGSATGALGVEMKETS